MKPRSKVAVVGAGWAGLAAAIEAVRRGHQVTLLEATRELGGRARTLALTLPDGDSVDVDNGQHILIGAYCETLALMRQVGVDPAQVLHAMPLALRFPDGKGLALPKWPPPLHAAWGIATARGWSWRDKVALVLQSLRWRLEGFQCEPHVSVSQLCAELPPAVVRDLVDPLCVAALNVPAARASGAVFLRVLRDALFGPAEGAWNASTLLLPKVDLGRMFPQAGAAWLQAQGAQVRLGARVAGLRPDGASWQVDGEPFDAVVLACPPWEAVRLVAGAADAKAWLEATQALAFEAIATVYVTGGPRLPLPMLALHARAGRPAQFVFDRRQLGGPRGLLAFVVSASQGDARTVHDQVLDQAAELGWTVTALKTVVEKRATFACTPGVRRPPIAVAPGLVACGDYVEGPYPATLEGAVRAALQAVQALDGATGR